MSATRKQQPFSSIFWAIVAFYVLKGLFLFPANGFCVEADKKKTLVKAPQNTSPNPVPKEDLKSRRPNQNKGATEVTFLMFVMDIDSINAATQNFSVNIFVRLHWKDSRLAHSRSSARQIPLEKVWNPQIVLANRQGKISKSLPEIVHVESDGTVSYRQRYSGMLSQPLQLKNFPMDKHTFKIHFVSAGGYRPDEVKFLPSEPQSDNGFSGGSIAKKLSLPDWKLLDFDAVELPYQTIKDVEAAGFAFRFEAKRYVTYYIWQILLPMVLVVMMSWAAFWVQRDQIGVRIGIATSSILTLIAHRFVLASKLPKLPYMTRMDYFTVGSTFLVFMVLIGVVSVSYLVETDRNETAKKAELLARIVFPSAFLLLLGWFVFR